MKKCFLLFLKPREHNFFENISTFLPNWNIFFFVVENFRGTNFARKRDELVNAFQINRQSDMLRVLGHMKKKDAAGGHVF